MPVRWVTVATAGPNKEPRNRLSWAIAGRHATRLYMRRYLLGGQPTRTGRAKPVETGNLRMFAAAS